MRHSRLEKLLNGNAVRIKWDESELEYAMHLNSDGRKIDYCGLPCRVTNVILKEEACIVELKAIEHEIDNYSMEEDYGF